MFINRIFSSVLITLGVSGSPICQALPCLGDARAVGNQVTTIKRTGVGTPYTLLATITTQFTQADGMIVSGFMTSRQVRDSHGRTRIDDPTVCLLDKDHQPRWGGNVTILDPVAKTRTDWQVNQSMALRSVHVTHLPYVTISIPPAAGSDYRMAKILSKGFDQAGLDSAHTVRFQAEDLGKRTILGLDATGSLVIRTVPAGMMGNSSPLVFTDEEW